MASRRRNPDIFFEYFWVSAMLMAMVGLFVFLGSLIYFGSKEDWSKESFRYKQVLFLSVVGKEIGVNDIDVKDVTTDNKWAEYIGKYIREEHKRGKSVDDILKQYYPIKEMFGKLRGSNYTTERNGLANLLRGKNVAWEVMSMAQDWRFWELADNSEDLKLLNLALSSKDSKIPPMSRKDLPVPFVKLILIWLLAIQSISYLVCMCNSAVPAIDEISWNSVDTYFAILINSPGAWPLMVINPILTSGFKSVGKSWNDQNHRNIDLKRMASNPSVSSQELLTRLNERLSNKRRSSS